VQAVVTDVPQCGGAQYAADNGIPVYAYPPRKKSAVQLDHIRYLETDKSLNRVLVEEARVDYVLLAGYLKLVPSSTVRAFAQRMLNIHPGLLPAFGGKGMYGSKVHEAVIASGSR
jgi:phosphoribosylglycinamide formyltransferase